VLTRDGRLDVLTVRTERRTGASPESAAEAAAALEHAAKAAIGVTIRVDVLDPGAVERSAGKMRRVLDER
jgi:phenylacetate-CoA ligase